MITFESLRRIKKFEQWLEKEKVKKEIKKRKPPKTQREKDLDYGM